MNTLPAGDEIELRQTLLEYQAILENALVGITFTRSRRFLHCNERFAEMYGWSQEELVGKPTTVVYPSQEAFDALGRIAIPILGRGERLDTELVMAKRDGSTFWCRMLAKAIDPTDHSKGTIFVTEDISARQAADEALKQSLLEQQAILDNAQIGISFLKERVIVRHNRRLEEIFGYQPGELDGVSTRVMYRSDSEYEDNARIYDAVLRTGFSSREFIMRKKDGTDFWCRISGQFVEPGDPSKGSVWLQEDVTERKHAEQALLKARDELERRVEERTAELAAANARLQAEIHERRLAEEQVRHLALHDALTGLPNRRLLEDRIEHVLTAARRTGARMAVMFVDLDRFKAVNDTLGHRVGDLLLQEVANRLRAALRANDTISRIGGDEFVALLPETGSAVAAAEVASRILESLAQPYLIEHHELHVTPSIGISLYPEHGTEVEILINHADAAMYRAKQMGRMNFQLFAADVGSVVGAEKLS